jgi:hypothetical protein
MHHVLAVVLIGVKFATALSIVAMVKMKYRVTYLNLMSVVTMNTDAVQVIVYQ